jgi:hypothetical protein
MLQQFIDDADPGINRIGGIFESAGKALLT